jgi:hypothetical protein
MARTAASMNHNQEYVFERPPPLTGAAGTAGSGWQYHAAQQQQQHAVIATSRSSSTSSLLAATGGGSGAYLIHAGEQEFAPWEEILLDMTAWMIAICLCYDYSCGENVEEDDEKHETNQNRRPQLQRHGRQNTKQHHQEENEDQDTPSRST